MKRIVIVFFLLLSMNYARSQYFESCDNGDALGKSMVFNEQKIKNNYDSFLNSMPNSKTASFKFYKKSKEYTNDFFSKLYIKFYGGYGFFTPGSYRVQSLNSVSYRDQNNVTNYIDIQTQGKKGIGGGARIGGGIGFAMNDFLNIGIDGEFQKGDKPSNSLTTATNEFNYKSTYDEMDYNAISLTPHIIFKALAKPNYFIYNKLGIVFTLPFTLNTSGQSGNSSTYSSWPANASDSNTSSRSILNITYEGKYKISLGIGFNVAFGVNFRLNDHLRIFGEAFGNFSALSPSRSTINSVWNFSDSSYEGIYDNNSPYNLLYYQTRVSTYPSTTTYNTTYVKSGGTNDRGIYLTGYNGSIPNYLDNAKEQKFTVNMNVIGIHVGIIYRLK